MLKRRYLNISFIAISTLIVIIVSVQVASGNDFRVFECTVYSHKPNLKLYGIEPIRIIYAPEMYEMKESEWFEALHKGMVPDLSTPPNPKRLMELGKKYMNDPVIVLDYEGLEAYKVPIETYRTNIATYISMAHDFRKGNPKSLFGFYGVPPISDLGRVLQYPVPQSLKADNDQLMPLVKFLDILFPSLYTWDPNVAKWLKAAKATLLEAKRVAQGKPVYAFIWPRFHEMNKTLRGRLIPNEYWRNELEFIHQNADGLVIWDGNREKWDSNWHWWHETMNFLKKIGKY